MSAYCCTGGHDHAGGAAPPGPRSPAAASAPRRAGRPPRPRRRRRRGPTPAPRLRPRRRCRRVRPPPAASAWLMTSCWETPISQRSVRASGDPTRRATVRAGSVSDQVPWGTAMQSMRAEQAGRAGVGRGGDHGVGHEIDDRRGVIGGAEPDQDGQARVEGAHRSGHDGRCYGPAMATGEAGRWEAELEDFTKESFEADGKRRDVFRIGTGPAVIVISEIPGITPLVAQFGRRVAAAGCTAVLPRAVRRSRAPGNRRLRARSPSARPASRGSSPPSPSRGPARSRVWLRKLAAAEHERCGGPGVGVVGMCFTGRLRAGHDGRRHRAGAGAQPAVAAVPALQEVQGGHRHLRRRPRPGEGAHRGGHLPARPALHQRPLLLRGALRDPAPRARRRLHRGRDRLGPGQSARPPEEGALRADRAPRSTRRARRRGPRSTRRSAFFREKLGVGSGPGPRPASRTS